MTLGTNEFVYKLPGVRGGGGPGAHRSHSRGAGMAFAAHARLFDHPDPRRIDLHASLSSLHRDWRVRINYQRSSVNIKALVDVSASMHFGSAQSKLGLAANFLVALGYSAYRAGDAVGMLAFDRALREDLYMPARIGRDIGHTMAAAIRGCEASSAAGAIDGLAACAEQIAGSGGLVFLVSDFHWPLDRLSAVLDKIADALVVPLVVWDKAEIEPPAQGSLLSVRDAESGHIRRLWLRQKIRRQWRDNVMRRRAEIGALFAANDIHPFYVDGNFDAERLSQYFLEKVA